MGWLDGSLFLEGTAVGPFQLFTFPPRQRETQGGPGRFDYTLPRSLGAD